MRHPELKVLLTSGYTPDMAGARRIDPAKPFDMDRLAAACAPRSTTDRFASEAP
jgi:phage tail sheath gpL-like